MAEAESEGLARSNVDNGLEGLLRRLGFPEHELWVTGSNNFRYQVYPEYKANRLKTPRPKHLKACVKHLMDVHGAHMSDGCEADDMLGIAQCTASEHGEETILSSIDKDLLMIPGWHYIPELKRNGIVTRPEERRVVSPLDGAVFFYTQLLTGDSTDNIKGVKGIGKVGAKRLLAEGDEERMFQMVRDCYSCDEELEMNARCLWIQRKPNENIVERWQELFNYERQE